MAHVGIFGPTECGKTTLARYLAREYLAQGIAVLVFNPIGNAWAEATWQTDNPDLFMQKVQVSRSCALFFEEGTDEIDRQKKYTWLFTRSRHLGHRMHVIGHGGSFLTPTMRNSISRLFLFRSSEAIAKLWAEDLADKRVFEACDLNQYEFLNIARFRAPIKSKLLLGRRGKITIADNSRQLATKDGN